MTLKKPLLIASLGAAVALGGVSTQASAADPIVGALIGGGIGAAIGDSTHHRNGAAVGGVLGAIIGSSIAADANRHYYDGGYYGDPYYGDRYYGGSRYYAPAPSYGYYSPAPRYYGPPAATIVYRSGPSYRYRGHRHHRHHDRRWR